MIFRDYVIFSPNAIYLGAFYLFLLIYMSGRVFVWSTVWKVIVFRRDLEKISSICKDLRIGPWLVRHRTQYSECAWAKMISKTIRMLSIQPSGPHVWNQFLIWPNLAWDNISKRSGNLTNLDRNNCFINFQWPISWFRCPPSVDWK